LKDDTGTFSISPETGQLKLLRELDRETTAQYQLTVTATDGGAHRLLSKVEASGIRVLSSFLFPVVLKKRLCKCVYHQTSGKSRRGKNQKEKTLKKTSMAKKITIKK